MANGEQFKTIERHCKSIIQLIKQDALQKKYLVSYKKQSEF